MTDSDAIRGEQSVTLKLFVVLSKAYKTIMERATKDMKQYGLSPSEFMVLEVIYTKRRIPLQQIGDKILVTSGSITYNIDKLESKGLMKRVPSAEDRRIIYAEITEKGDTFFTEIFARHTEMLHDVMRALGTDEKRHAIDLLKKLGKGAATGPVGRK